MTAKARIAKAILKTESYLHPRIFKCLVCALWPMLRDRDGFMPVKYDSIEMRVDLREGIERQVFLKVYDPPLTKFIQQNLRSGDVVVDVGSNCGAITTVAANAVGTDGRVLSIEPNPKLAARLNKNARLNPLNNIKVFADAVGDKPGRLPFYISSSHPYSSLDKAYLPDYKLDSVIWVHIETLDDLLMRELNGLPIQLLKLDVQGYENRILLGAKKIFEAKPPAFIVMEIVNQNLTETLEYLSRADYRFFGLTETGELTEPAFVQGHNLVCIHLKHVQ